MYETITVLLPEIQEICSTASWIEEGSTKKAFIDPNVYNDKIIDRLYESIYQFIDNHHEFELTQYNRILKENCITGNDVSYKDMDLSYIDGKLIMAMIVSATRMDHFCNGYILNYFEDGSLVKWIKRLKEIDDKDK